MALWNHGSGRLVAAAAVTVLGTSLAVSVGAPGAQSAGWSPTSTKALSLAQATKLGAADPATPLRLTVGLAPRDRAGIDQLITSQSTPGSADYRHYLTTAEFTDRFAATAATAESVRSYLAGQGMHDVVVAPNRLQVTADATVAQAQQAFHTSIASFQQFGKTVLANTAAAQVPSSLAGAVTGVLGLSSLGASTAPPAGAPRTTGFYPKEFTTVYDSGTTRPGTGTALAVIAQGDLTQTVKDLRTAEAAQSLPQVPVKLVYAGPKSSDTSGAVEWNLDTQTSTGVAPKAKALYIYVATTLTDSDLARAINLFVSQNVAKAGSASLGECDILPYLDGSMTVDDMAFAEAAVQGQTFFASSGDTGSSCAVLPTNGVPGSGPTDTEYPASSTYVMGVGGTTLLADDSTDAYQSEVAWNAGGGGLSPVEYPGPWTSGVNLASTAGLRGVPDVAFDADPVSGANIYADGSTETVGGTSLASPLALGLWTRLQSSAGNQLGFAPARLYGYYSRVQAGNPTTAVPGFHDVVLGANGAYTALPGYDYTTGLGSWDVKKLSVALR